MGDRTTTTTTIAAADLATVRELLLGNEWRDQGFAEEYADDDDTLTFLQNDVNHGGEEDADALQKAGVPFIIHHDSGSSYPEGFIVFDGKTRDAFYGLEGGLIISFDEDTGSANEKELAQAREFLALKQRAKERMLARGEERSAIPRTASIRNSGQGR